MESTLPPPVCPLPARLRGVRVIALMAFTLIVAGQCQSQLRPPGVDVTNYDTVGYGFLRQEVNAIENAAYLEPVFQKMYRQRIEGGQKISIVHLGDSHVLGNYLTHEVRVRLQNAFGDAGRGLIFPYKLAGSNGPRDYLVETDVRWYGTNCQRVLDEETPYGISGFMLESFNPNGNLTIRLRDTTTSETRLFTKVTVFYHPEEQAFDLAVRDEVTNQEAILFLQDKNFKSFYFDRPVAQATLSYNRLNPGKKTSLTLDGILLENELSGVVYHSIGVNGGKFSDFVRARYFARQLADLNPDLIILSFGTNEAQGKLSPKFIYQQMDDLVNQLQRYAPNAYLLFTTPADSYLKGRGFNPYMEQVSATIRHYAQDNHFAVWDLFHLSGGEHSAQVWKSAGLMASDSVHYSKVGYAAQGKLFYQSLIQAYNDFVEQRTGQ